MVDPAFPSHRKLRKLAGILKISPAAALGHVVSLWCRVMLESPSGDTKGWDERDISAASMWDGDAKVFADALGACLLIDRRGRVHQWVEHQGDIIEKRQQWKKRQQDRRGKSSVTPSSVTRDSTECLRPPFPSLPIPSVPIPSVPIPSLPSRTENEAGVAVERGDAKHVQAAKAKAELFDSEACKNRVLEFIGYLENNPLITYASVLELVTKVWNIRQGLTMSDGVPADKIVAYALSQTMKAKVFNASYIGTVVRNATIKWRENALQL